MGGALSQDHPARVRASVLAKRVGDIPFFLLFLSLAIRWSQHLRVCVCVLSQDISSLSLRDVHLKNRVPFHSPKVPINRQQEKEGASEQARKEPVSKRSA